MTKLIQEGPRDARIMLVGEAPGATEEMTGRPFVGGSGDLLNRMLSTVGISRGDCFITNLCHIRPPGNEFAHFLKPKPKIELITGLMQLKKDIEEVQPNVIVALGTQPLRFLTGRVGIDKWRGSVLESKLVPGRKVVGTYHPAYVLRIWDYKAVAEFDLKRCAKEAAFGEIRRPMRNLVLNPTREDSIWLESQLLNASWLSIDIECFETETGWKLACVGFSDSARRAVVWPCNESWQMEIIKRLCTSDIKKVFQNGTFDITVLNTNGIVVPYSTFQYDTMLGHHALFTECASGEPDGAGGAKKKQAALAKGLGFQVSIYTDEPFYKDMGKVWKRPK